MRRAYSGADLPNFSVGATPMARVCGGTNVVEYSCCVPVT